MGFFSGIFKGLKKAASVALPIIGTAVGGPIGGAIGGAAGSAINGGGFKDALLSGTAGFAGAGGLGSPATAINWTSAAPGFSTGLQTFGGSGLLGALTKGTGGLSNLTRSVGGGGFGGGAGNLLSNVLGGFASDRALRGATKGQLLANRAAQANLAPFLNTGTGANARLSELLGLDPDADQDEILEALRNQPGYQFREQEGQQALDRSLAASGSLASGRALKEAQRFGQGLADQSYSDYANRLAQQSGQGQQSALLSNILLGEAGDIRGNRKLNRADILNKSVANILVPQRY